MGQFSLLHWLIVGIIIVLLFGVRRLPELGSGLGQAITNFKKAYREGQALDVTPKIEESKTSSDEKKEEKKD